MKKLVLLRHGESIWNKQNLFTGWTDVELSGKGVMEAKKAGEILKEEGFSFDVAYTSVLKRAIKTLWIVLEEMDLMWIPVFRSWRLNERHYGALQGLDKAETLKKYGEEQFMLWRRSYDVRPPSLDKSDERYPGVEAKYKTLTEAEIPVAECLKDTYDRMLPYWNTVIVPQLEAGRKIIIAAHGNSLRALAKHLDSLSNEAVVQLNIPTGVPLVYELDDGLKASRSYYLGDPEAVQKAAQAVAKQGRTDSS